eukprot:3951747-Amphidinium_carterae.1
MTAVVSLPSAVYLDRNLTICTRLAARGDIHRLSAYDSSTTLSMFLEYSSGGCGIQSRSFVDCSGVPEKKLTTSYPSHAIVGKAMQMNVYQQMNSFSDSRCLDGGWVVTHTSGSDACASICASSAQTTTH